MVELKSADDVHVVIGRDVHTNAANVRTAEEENKTDKVCTEVKH